MAGPRTKKRGGNKYTAHLCTHTSGLVLLSTGMHAARRPKLRNCILEFEYGCVRIHRAGTMPSSPSSGANIPSGLVGGSEARNTSERIVALSTQIGGTLFRRRRMRMYPAQTASGLSIDLASSFISVIIDYEQNISCHLRVSFISGDAFLAVLFFQFVPTPACPRVFSTCIVLTHALESNAFFCLRLEKVTQVSPNLTSTLHNLYCFRQLQGFLFSTVLSTRAFVSSR
jgi:hypothetical protein